MKIWPMNLGYAGSPFVIDQVARGSFYIEETGCCLKRDLSPWYLHLRGGWTLFGPKDFEPWIK